MSHKRKHSFLNGQPAFKESVLNSQWDCFIRPLYEVIHTNSCHLHFSATCKVHSQDALADTPKKCNAAHFWWLVGDTLVVAFGFLPQKIGNWLGSMNDDFAQK